MTELPLVCIGGTLCDARLFAPLLERLGRAATPLLLGTHDRAETAATALLDSIPGPFIALGFSLGGFVAIEAMRQQPARVKALILISGNAFPDAPENAATRRDDVESARAVGLAPWMAARTALLFPESCTNRESLTALVADMAASVGDEAHARQAEMNIHRPDFRAMLAVSPAPILALAGSADALCPAERYNDLARNGISLEIIDGAGHYVPLEQPHRCARAITSFLQENRL